MATTPMMRQWTQIKRAHPSCIIMFRLGDFYEAFNEDAQQVAEVCDVTLTSRPVSKGERIPMAGVPYHAVDGYIAQMVRHGLKVAIVEQTGSEASPEKRARMSRLPAADETTDVVKGGGRALMDRQVVRIVTPGTLVEGDLLEARANNYLAALAARPGGFGLAHVDVTTGEFATTEVMGDGADRRLVDEVVRLRPAELLVPEREDASLTGLVERLTDAVANLRLPTVIMPYAAWRFDADNAERTLLEHFAVASLAGFGCQDRPMATAAAGAVLAYLQETQRGAVRQVTALWTYSPDAYMALDAATRRNLEITASLRGDGWKGTLLWVLDLTETAMGARRLRSWLDQPLLDRDRITHRLDGVEALARNGRLRAEVRAALKGLPDLERLANRVLAGYAGPKELQALARGLHGVPRLRQLLAAAHGDASIVGPGDPSNRAREQPELDPGAPPVDHSRPTAHAGGLPAVLAGLCGQDVAKLAARVDAAIADDPPAALGSAGVVRAGYAEEVDGIHAAVADARAWIAGLEARERERTGLKGLKVGYNKVFGYYLELPKSQAERAPEDYDRKQTLVDAERYSTPALKERETEVLHAEERILAVERQLYLELVAFLSAAAEEMLAAARDVALLDCLAALAEAAVRYDYARPELDDGRELVVEGSRHPVVERMRPNVSFVPNDLGIGQGQIILLTGPNMAGKSTMQRQLALLVLMAQIGSFVPARRARFGVVDRIFTRIGAQDEIAMGQSTFMVEMVETANILHHATERSLLILDELGRGTSTYDGMAIAWAVVEHIHNHPRLGARTVFSTHYHELTQLAELLPRVKNYNMVVAESEGGVVFLHRVEPGSADRSYGIHVAELAGLPRDVTTRAWEILSRLEAEANVPLQPAGERPPPLTNAQLSLFAPSEREHPLVDRIRSLDPDSMTPLEALALLYELRRQARRDD